MLYRNLLICSLLLLPFCRFGIAQETPAEVTDQKEMDRTAEAPDTMPANESSAARAADAGNSLAQETEAHAVAGHAAGGHGEHHQDPTVGGSGESLNNLLAWQTEKAIWTALVFLIMLGLLYAVAWKPIGTALEKRERTIANNISDAKNASDQALAKLKEYESRLATASGQANEILASARKDAEVAAERIVNEAQAEGARQRDRALAEIESAKQNALSDLTAKSTDMAFSLARRVVGREVNASDHQQLIQESLKHLPSRN